MHLVDDLQRGIVILGATFGSGPKSDVKEILTDRVRNRAGRILEINTSEDLHLYGPLLSPKVVRCLIDAAVKRMASTIRVRVTGEGN